MCRRRWWGGAEQAPRDAWKTRTAYEHRTLTRYALESCSLARLLACLLAGRYRNHSGRTCLLHQKLQMLNCCITEVNLLRRRQEEASGWSASAPVSNIEIPRASFGEPINSPLLHQPRNIPSPIPVETPTGNRGDRSVESVDEASSVQENNGLVQGIAKSNEVGGVTGEQDGGYIQGT